MKQKAKTTLRSLIAAEMLRVCTAATIVPEVGGRKFSTEKIEGVLAAITKIGWDAGSNPSKALMEAFSVLFDAPELTDSGGVFPVLSVILLGENKTGHGYALNTPLIVSHSINRRLMHDDGHLSRWNFGLTDKPRRATMEEIEKCIASLTDAQWKTVGSDPLFAPIMQAVLDRDIELVTEEPKVKRKKKTDGKPLEEEATVEPAAEAIG